MTLKQFLNSEKEEKGVGQNPMFDKAVIPSEKFKNPLEITNEKGTHDCQNECLRNWKKI